MAKLKFPTYWDYLRLDEMLDLQGGVEGDETQLMPDELHFILVHQTMELWFKLVIRELRLARDHLAAPTLPEDRVPYVVHHLRRINEILRLCVQQFQVVETLTPQDFLAFRDKLVPASGFQSFQLREIEILMGLEEAQRATLGKVQAMDYIKKLADKSPAGARAWRHISTAREETTLRHALHDWLYRTPIQGSTPEDPNDEQAVDAFLEAGPKAVEFYETQTALQFDLGPFFADYHPTAPGGMDGGRSIVARPFDGRELGDEIKRLRPPLREAEPVDRP